jgi:hypothetical protein
MSYLYQTERPFIFTEEGQVMFLNIRDRVQHLLKQAGAVRLQELISGCTGGSWSMLACVDRLVELGELHELTIPNSVAAQHRVFVKA